jgi:uncharacterized protein YozE (UPF0346 family)
MTSLSLGSRKYLHGDRHEAQTSLYYCSRCDAFEAEGHFFDLDAHVLDHFERFAHALKVWKESSGSRLHRPKDAINVIQMKMAAKPKVTSAFFRWLMRQIERNDPIGDLAKDLVRDSAYPEDCNDLAELRSYLAHRTLTADVLVAFDEACDQFKSKKSYRTSLSVSLRFEIFKRDGYRCCICGNSAQDGQRLEVDHKLAVAKGGTNDVSNLWTLCGDCNRGKGVRNL